MHTTHDCDDYRNYEAYIVFSVCVIIIIQATFGSDKLR